jgi:ubiquinone/menaquinone biosynthesis C-methylase UbiE
MKPEISRVQRSKAQAKASYNKLSRWYDLLAGSTERKYNQIGLGLLNVSEGENVLEIGYGTGHGILALAQSVGDRGKVFGIDLSENMHAITQKRIYDAGLSKCVELHVGDAAELPFDLNSMDAVFMSFTLELFDTPEIPLVLKHCTHVLRPAGRICLVAMAKQEQDNFMVKLYEWFHVALPNYADCRPIYAYTFLKDAGFEVHTRKKMSMWGLPVEIMLGFNAKGTV